MPVIKVIQYGLIVGNATYEIDFVTTLNTYLQANIPGARASVDTGTRPDVINTSKIQFDCFFDGLFGGDY